MKFAPCSGDEICCVVILYLVPNQPSMFNVVTQTVVTILDLAQKVAKPRRQT